MPNELSPSRIRAFQLRQRDTDWGYAWAHLLPLVPLYYAVTRRTLTPMFVDFLGTVAIMLLLVIPASVLEDESDSNVLLAFGQLTTIIATPFLVKNGIDRARKAAQQSLLDANQDLKLPE